MSCDEKWTCEKWSSQEVLCTAPAARSQPRPSGAHARRRRTLCVMRLPRERQPGSCLYCACHAKPAAAQRRPRAPQLRQDALCTAPATRKAARKLSVLRLPREASRGPAAPTRAAAPPCRKLCVLRLPRERQPGSSLYCACHAKPAAAQRRPRALQLRQEALCTAPATQKAARKLFVLRLPREASREPGRSVYCAYYAKGSQEALCTAPATRSQPRPSGAHARRSSARRLCVLRLPRERQPGSSLYCACHVKPAAAQRRPRATQLRQDALCTAPATRKAARKLSVLRLPREASREPGRSVYCAYYAKGSRKLSVLRLPREANRGPAAPTRAAAPPGRSVYCACHAKGSQEALCILRLPREASRGPQRRPRAPQLRQEALCTAPATRKAARKLSVLRLPREASRGPAAPKRAAAPPGRSVYCACHAKGSQEAVCIAPATRSEPRPCGAHARRSSARRLCVMRLLHERQPGSSVYCACHAKPAAAQRRPCAPQLRQDALCTAPATRKAARKLSVLRLPREASPQLLQWEWKWVRVSESEWEWVRVRVSESEWEWVSESEWVSEWVSAWEWVRVSESEWEWVRVSESEWEWVRVSESEWESEWVSEWRGGGGPNLLWNLWTWPGNAPKPPRPSPEPSANFLRNPVELDLALHQSLPHLLRNPVERDLALHQSLPDLLRNLRNLRWTWPSACTSAHRSFSGLKTPLAYAVGEKAFFKRHPKVDYTHTQKHCKASAWVRQYAVGSVFAWVSVASGRTLEEPSATSLRFQTCTGGMSSTSGKPYSAFVKREWSWQKKCI